ncbi:multidrug ABC transporter ATP-binding protein [Clostridia bacterium]|nr:multidrug ABC transporter ATP-binding protein [Clostridia bacterium]
MIEITNLIKRFGGNIAVNDVSFSVEKGEIVGFLGPNGAGKTTTLNIITGYLSCTTGSAKIDGIDILENPIEAKKRIGFLPEQPPLYVDMTVKEYLNFSYQLKNCKLNKVKHLREIMEVVKIADVENRVIRNLSKGYKQRVGIAQALVGNPKVLIFDEPTVGLDPKQIIDIRNLIKALGKDHTIILSTHILPEVQAICDRIVIINKGEIVANEKTENISNAVMNTRRLIVKIAGPAEDILHYLKDKEGIMYAEILREQKDLDATAFLVEGQPKIDIRKPLFFGMAEKGWAIVGMESLGMSLEDIFIRLITDKSKKERKVIKNS